MKRTRLKNKNKHAANDKRVKAELRKRYDPFACIFCGREESEYTVIDAAHLLGKGAYPEYRTVVENVVPACRDCHFKYDDNYHFRFEQDEHHNLTEMKERIKADEFQPLCR